MDRNHVFMRREPPAVNYAAVKLLTFAPSDRLSVWCRRRCWHGVRWDVGTVSMSGECSRTSVHWVRCLQNHFPRFSTMIADLQYIFYFNQNVHVSCQASTKLLFSHSPPTEVWDWGWHHTKRQTSALRLRPPRVPRFQLERLCCNVSCTGQYTFTSGPWCIWCNNLNKSQYGWGTGPLKNFL